MSNFLIERLKSKQDSEKREHSEKAIKLALASASQKSFDMGLLAAMAASALEGDSAENTVERARTLALAESVGLSDPERLKRKTGLTEAALAILRRGHSKVIPLNAIRNSL